MRARASARRDAASSPGRSCGSASSGDGLDLVGKERGEAQRDRAAQREADDGAGPLHPERAQERPDRARLVGDGDGRQAVCRPRRAEGAREQVGADQPGARLLERGSGTKESACPAMRRVAAARALAERVVRARQAVEQHEGVVGARLAPGPIGDSQVEEGRLAFELEGFGQGDGVSEVRHRSARTLAHAPKAPQTCTLFACPGAMGDISPPKRVAAPSPVSRGIP